MKLNPQRSAKILGKKGTLVGLRLSIFCGPFSPKNRSEQLPHHLLKSGSPPRLLHLHRRRMTPRHRRLRQTPPQHCVVELHLKRQPLVLIQQRALLVPKSLENLRDFFHFRHRSQIFTYYYMSI